MISSSIKYQNAILDLLNGRLNINDNEVKEIENDVVDTSINGGDNATEALEKIFIEGGAKTKTTEQNEIHDVNEIRNIIENKSIEGGEVNDTDELEKNNDDVDNEREMEDDGIISTSEDDVDYDEKNDSDIHTSDVDDAEIKDIMNEILNKTETINDDQPLLGGGITKPRSIIVNDLDKYPYVLRHFKQE